MVCCVVIPETRHISHESVQVALSTVVDSYLQSSKPESVSQRRPTWAAASTPSKCLQRNIQQTFKCWTRQGTN